MKSPVSVLYLYLSLVQILVTFHNFGEATDGKGKEKEKVKVPGAEAERYFQHVLYRMRTGNPGIIPKEIPSMLELLQKAKVHRTFDHLDIPEVDELVQLQHVGSWECDPNTAVRLAKLRDEFSLRFPGIKRFLAEKFFTYFFRCAPRIIYRKKIGHFIHHYPDTFDKMAVFESTVLRQFRSSSFSYIPAPSEMGIDLNKIHGPHAEEIYEAGLLEIIQGCDVWNSTVAPWLDFASLGPFSQKSPVFHNDPQLGAAQQISTAFNQMMTANYYNPSRREAEPFDPEKDYNDGFHKWLELFSLSALRCHE